MWRAFEAINGFPATRQEAVTAMSGAAMCRSWGAKINPVDLIPRYEQPKKLSYKEGAGIFAAYARHHNEKVNNKHGK